MKRIFSSLLLTTCFLTTPFLTTVMLASGATKRPNDLSYKFYNQRIALVTKPNQVAVVFNPVSNTSRGMNDDEPSYIKLQQTLAGESSSTSRGMDTPEDLKIEVKPLGTQYAILTLPSNRSIDLDEKLKNRLQQSYIQTSLPVFQRKNAGKDEEETVVLNNEMIVGFEPGTSKIQIDEILRQNDAEVVRPMRFSKNRYLVRSRSAKGAELFSVIDQLTSITGVQSVSPNFIQSVSYQPLNRSLTAALPESAPPPTLASLPKLMDSPYPDSLISQQWHLNSSLQKGTGARTDIHAIEAWKQGNRGQGAVVAVIDSAIQWDHPDLQANLYEVPQNLPDLLPGEVHGWNFAASGDTETCAKNDAKDCVQGNPDTRLSAKEVSVIKPHFQGMFQSDELVLKRYPKAVSAIKKELPKLSDAKLAAMIRSYILNEVSGEFHGTWVSGVIAAKPQAAGGAVGVAPNAKILPVRVFGLGGSVSADTVIEAIGYAAARKVDVINLSLGSLLPTEAEAAQIFSVLDANPNLMIVASSGNNNIDGSGYPASIPGVLSVGSSNLAGNRSMYSNYGRRLDVMAPGGDTSRRKSGGILTTGGTFITSLWEGITVPQNIWGPNFDVIGKYVQVQGTSFSAPTVTGVVALMKAEDPDHKLTRDQMMAIIRGTASYKPLQITEKDQNYYRLQKGVPSTPIYGIPIPKSGIEQPGETLPIEQYYFGKGLVNAEAAVSAVKQQVNPQASGSTGK
jgi:serine protease